MALIVVLDKMTPAKLTHGIGISPEQEIRLIVYSVSKEHDLRKASMSRRF